MPDSMNESEARAIEFLAKRPIHNLALSSCITCGLVTYPLLQLLCEKEGLSTNHNTVRGALKSLTKPVEKLNPMLRELSMRIHGRAGASILVYAPTEFGRRLLELRKFTVPEPQNAVGLAHRYIQLEIYAHALKSDGNAEVEKVLYYDNGRNNIRVDVMVTFTRELDLPGYFETDEFLFEAEQELLPSNAKRAVEKVRNWQEYGLPGEYPHIVIVFNMPRKKLEQTIALWQEALQIVIEEDESLTFQISYILLTDLLELPLREAIREYSLDLAPDYAEDGEREGDSQLSTFARQLREYQPFTDLLEQFEMAVSNFRDAKKPADRLHTFFAMMRCIHEASDLSTTGTAYLYNQLPIESLHLLYHYLTLPENLPLYEELRRAIHWMQSRNNLGVTMLREINTQIIWDVFLAHHGFARGGKLEAGYEIADHLEVFKTFGVRVFYHGSETSVSSTPHPNDAALEWVLKALFTYAEPLGLGRLPWKKQSKGGDA